MADDDSLPEGLTFPCTLDIKIFLKTDPDNFSLVREVILKHVCINDLIRISDKTSRGGRYQSLSCRVKATNRQQMDNLYRGLTGHPEILMVI